MHKTPFPGSQSRQIVSLGDIAMYTDADEVPLSQVLENARKLYDGARADVKALVAEGRLRDEFARILPDFDRERVYDNDIKKFFTWYNILIDAGCTAFVEAEPEGAAKEAAEYAAESQD